MQVINNTRNTAKNSKKTYCLFLNIFFSKLYRDTDSKTVRKLNSIVLYLYVCYHNLVNYFVKLNINQQKKRYTLI